MQVTYVTQKYFPNGEVEMRLKNRERPDDVVRSARNAVETRVNRAEVRRLRQECMKKRYSWLASQLTFFANPELEHQMDICRCAFEQRDIDNIRRSVQRCRDNLYDVLRCNDFSFFVTVTFDPEQVNRLDDGEVRHRWNQWMLVFRRKYPNAYYVAVPEYHKKGGLHFHMLIGGIEFDDLKPKHAYDEKKKRYLYVTRGRCKGDKIYNIDVWSLGWSTMTVLRELNAAKHYISKYITKQWRDSRFFGKKRYYVSRNIMRPVVKKATFVMSETNVYKKIDLARWRIDYMSEMKQYVRLSKREIPTYIYNGAMEDLAFCRPKNMNRSAVHKGRCKQTMRKSLLLRKSIR